MFQWAINTPFWCIYIPQRVQNTTLVLILASGAACAVGFCRNGSPAIFFTDDLYVIIVCIYTNKHVFTSFTASSPLNSITLKRIGFRMFLSIPSLNYALIFVRRTQLLFHVGMQHLVSYAKKYIFLFCRLLFPKALVWLSSNNKEQSLWCMDQLFPGQHLLLQVTILAQDWCALDSQHLKSFRLDVLFFMFLVDGNIHNFNVNLAFYFQVISSSLHRS